MWGLLGQRNGEVTTHYSTPTLDEFLDHTQ
jgi:hypothetical protein